MSASHVRQTTETFAQAVAAREGVAFYATINREVRPADALWWTVEYEAEWLEGETFCGPGYHETGRVYAIVLAQPGLGDLDAVDALERIVRGMLQETDPADRLVWQGLEPVFEASGGTADRTYRVSAPIKYRLNL